jgi:sulfopyruvate decarboxylase subunit beta
MIESFEAVKVISKHRGKAFIIADMTAGTELPVITKMADHDLPFNWAAMGKGSSLSLGLALARPDLKVFDLDGDGSLLTNLGTMLTIANMAPPNFIHFLFDNGVYRCTGGQIPPRGGQFNFALMATEAGYANVHNISDLATLEKTIDAIIDQVGPTFVRLEIKPGIGPAYPYVRASDCVDAFRAAIARC